MSFFSINLPERLVAKETRCYLKHKRFFEKHEKRQQRRKQRREHQTKLKKKKRALQSSIIVLKYLYIKKDFFFNSLCVAFTTSTKKTKQNKFHCAHLHFSCVLIYPYFFVVALFPHFPIILFSFFLQSQCLKK